jgi:hypothetical protein
MTPGSQFKEKSYLVAKVINMPKPKFPDARPLPRLVLLPLPELLLRPHEVSSGGIFDPGVLEIAHHPLG